MKALQPPGERLVGSEDNLTQGSAADIPVPRLVGSPVPPPLCWDARR